MCYGIVGFRRVHYFRHRFVGHKLECGEGDGHGKSSRVGNVERGKTFIPEDGFGAGQNCRICRAMDLHSLLDHCNQTVSACSNAPIAGSLRYFLIPSKGFIRASLAIVAHAPDDAVRCQCYSPPKFRILADQLLEGGVFHLERFRLQTP